MSENNAPMECERCFRALTARDIKGWPDEVDVQLCRRCAKIEADKYVERPPPSDVAGGYRPLKSSEGLVS